MLAYPLDEAEALLDGRLGNAKRNLENCEEDLEFLREQITVRLDYSLLNLVFPTEEWGADCPVVADDGGSNSPCLQLGCRAEAEGEGGR